MTSRAVLQYQIQIGNRPSSELKVFDSLPSMIAFLEALPPAQVVDFIVEDSLGNMLSMETLSTGRLLDLANKHK